MNKEILKITPSAEAHSNRTKPRSPSVRRSNRSKPRSPSVRRSNRSKPRRSAERYYPKLPVSFLKEIYNEPVSSRYDGTGGIHSARREAAAKLLPNLLQDKALEEKDLFSLLKDFMVTSEYIVIRDIYDFVDYDGESVRAKIGKYKVYYEPCNLYVIHSDWFERSDLRLENLSDVLSEQNWIERESIFVEHGYIGVLKFEQIPDDESSFETFYRKCYEEIDARRKSYYYVSKIGVVTNCEQGGHKIFTLENKNDETIGIKICLEDCGNLSDYY